MYYVTNCVLAILTFPIMKTFSSERLSKTYVSEVGVKVTATVNYYSAVLIPVTIQLTILIWISGTEEPRIYFISFNYTIRYAYKF